MDASPEDWRTALRLAATARRVLVLGAMDVGKSSFVRDALVADGARLLADLDPGQKMIGAPGTLSLGRLDRQGRPVPARFVFTGNTSPVPLPPFLAAARTLLRGRRSPLIVNTSGFVEGAGVPLQRLTIDTVRPELIVAITEGTELDPILAGLRGPAIVRTRPSLGARRKTPGERRQARQQAFSAALDGARRWTLPPDIAFIPAATAPLAGLARPVCAIADATGAHVGLGVVEAAGAEGVTVIASGRAPPAAIILGRMWVRPAGASWRLLDQARPGWDERLPGKGESGMTAGGEASG